MVIICPLLTKEFRGFWPGKSLEGEENLNVIIFVKLENLCYRGSWITESQWWLALIVFILGVYFFWTLIFFSRGLDKPPIITPIIFWPLHLQSWYLSVWAIQMPKTYLERDQYEAISECSQIIVSNFFLYKFKIYIIEHLRTKIKVSNSQKKTCDRDFMLSDTINNMQ